MINLYNLMKEMGSTDFEMYDKYKSFKAYQEMGVSDQEAFVFAFSQEEQRILAFLGLRYLDDAMSKPLEEYDEDQGELFNDNNLSD